MPYIDKNRRYLLDAGTVPPAHPGELNYMIHKLILDYLERWGMNYQHANDVAGVLHLVSAEFERRVLAGYEDKKIRENGDVYPSELVQWQNEAQPSS